MDIKATVEQLVNKIKGDPQLLGSFKSDPVGTVKKLVGGGIDDSSASKVADGVGAQLDVGDIADKAKGALGGIKGLFGK